MDTNGMKNRITKTFS